MTRALLAAHCRGGGRHLADAGLAGPLYDLADSSMDVSVTVDSPTLNRYDGVVGVDGVPVVVAALANARDRRLPARPGRASASGLTLTPRDGCVPMTCLNCRPRVGRVDR
jgi:hypothetical protein